MRDFLTNYIHLSVHHPQFITSVTLQFRDVEQRPSTTRRPVTYIRAGPHGPHQVAEESPFQCEQVTNIEAGSKERHFS